MNKQFEAFLITCGLVGIVFLFIIAIVLWTKWFLTILCTIFVSIAFYTIWRSIYDYLTEEEKEDEIREKLNSILYARINETYGGKNGRKKVQRSKKQ